MARFARILPLYLDVVKMSHKHRVVQKHLIQRLRGECSDVVFTQPQPLFYHISANDAASAMMTGAAAVATEAPLPGVSTWYFWLLEGASFVSSMVTVPVPCRGAMPNDLHF